MAGEDIKFQGRLLKVITEKRRLPNGHVSNLEIVRHPGAALIIPFLAKDRIILLRQYRPVIDRHIYELPAGTLEPDEKPLSCARREIVEEIGYCAKKFTKLGVIFPVPGYSTERIVIYRAERLMKDTMPGDDDEIIYTRAATKSKVRDLFKAGKIVDAKTICAFAFVGWL